MASFAGREHGFRAGDRDEIREAAGFGAGDRAAERRQAIVAAARIGGGAAGFGRGGLVHEVGGQEAG